MNSAVSKNSEIHPLTTTSGPALGLHCGCWNFEHFWILFFQQRRPRPHVGRQCKKISSRIQVSCDFLLVLLVGLACSNSVAFLHLINHGSLHDSAKRRVVRHGGYVGTDAEGFTINVIAAVRKCSMFGQFRPWTNFDDEFRCTKYVRIVVVVRCCSSSNSCSSSNCWDQKSSELKPSSSSTWWTQLPGCDTDWRAGLLIY